MLCRDLAPNPKNPRKISKTRLEQFKKSLLHFGDLSGIIYNRTTGQLVGGHQRVVLFDPKAPISISKKYAKPTKTGTVAEGFIELAGEKFGYREVNWPIAKEKAANIAANKGAGEWDEDLLAKWMQDLNKIDFDLDLTMFSESERMGLVEDLEKGFDPSSKKEEKPHKTCPNCGEPL